MPDDVVIFAPSPVLTVTVEDHAGSSDIHVHAGGQGVWQARMLVRLGVPVTMCSVLGGESGRILRHLLADEGVHLLVVDGPGRNGSYVHDRRGGQRVEIAEAEADPLPRHVLDELYGVVLGASLDAGAVVLSGPATQRVLPPGVYRRLAADLRAAGRPVIADLAGDRLTATLAGEPAVIKVSDEELLADGRVPAPADSEPVTGPALVVAMHAMREAGADTVIVTRSTKPALVLSEAGLSEVRVPTLQTADPRGAGDSFTAGVAACVARGGTMAEAVTLGAAAAMLNVTRHGLGTGQADTVHKLRTLVRLVPVPDPGTGAGRVTRHDLAHRLARP